MKVYIVTQGIYSDYRIEKVFLDPEKAKAHAMMINSKYEDAIVEVYDTFDDDVVVNKDLKGKVMFCYKFWKSKNRNSSTWTWHLIDCKGIVVDEKEEDNSDSIYVYLDSPDDEKAWKIFHDKLAMRKALTELEGDGNE